MILRIASSPISPLFQPLNFSTSTSSCSQIPLSFRSNAPVLRSESARFEPVRCSISQVHSYGTVDYEKRPAVKWGTLYRRISMMENPSLGSGVVLDQCEEEEEGKLSKWVVCRVARELRKFRRFKQALEVRYQLGPFLILCSLVCTVEFSSLMQLSYSRLDFFFF